MADPGRRVRLAVVDDSVFVRGALRRIFENDSRIHVVGCAATGEELLEQIGKWEPDVVTLDLNMPGMGGLATLDRVHAERPALPVIVLSSAVGDGAVTTIEALCREHVDFVDKQEMSLVDFSGMRRLLLERIEALTAPHASVPTAAAAVPAIAAGPVSAIVIGASTGGPPAIETILQELGRAAEVPIVIAQHMPPGFTRAFAQRLNAKLPLDVREPREGDALQAGTVFIAPGGYDLRLLRSGPSLVVVFDPARGESSTHPSVDALFESAAEVCGETAVGVLLSGMGTDGARGLAALRKQGAYTIVQDEPTCVVYGMPRAAVAIGAACEVAPLGGIGGRLKRLVGARPG